ncbi:virulence-associated E family protein [Salisediminibacterium selenitireducens]|uniref:Virulence-associated E family protein n=1 Tax=Bacillus selenitireducens (strain ATCC 700615 / DSM 15326 / MLS10) TaxID=439292 RepID=D6Y002_BACIE|nr:virulence-associated E family protein [Salisediminibacterium selenitireducens]ADI00504.1 virulence-associated E family protein [[Bacillus] selenitireducens MLS10]
MKKDDHKAPNLDHDGTITIAIGRSRKEMNWKNKEMQWSQFVKRILQTARTYETCSEYTRLPKMKQDDLKDVGGFVGGTLLKGKRGGDSVAWRHLVTLDADQVAGDLWETVKLLFGHACAMYTTHKHRASSPRMRLIIPLKRAVTAEEYVPIARKIADQLGIDQFDDSTYEPQRLMYWPSTSKDGEFLSDFIDAEWLNPDEILNSYSNWRDSSFWPESSREINKRHKMAEKQGDPRSKPGVVGAFCRTYTIHEVIETFLPKTYQATEDPNRYSYFDGTTAGGLVVYQDGDFAYSHHASDPVGGKLCNAFDLLRLHKFGDLDVDADPNTPVTRLPSYMAMVDEALADKEVALLMGKERLNEAKLDFGDEDDDDDQEWLQELQFDAKGRFISNAANVEMILKNDPRLINTVAKNDFQHRYTVLRDLPWRSLERGEYWVDADDAGLRNYLSKIYQIKGPSIISDAWTEVVVDHAYHPVRDYLNGLEWDGQERIDTLFIDYLGADDSDTIRTFTRLILTAAVARIFEPGIKFDYCVVLIGPQGIGKSQIIKLLGRDWHSDSLITVKGKEAFEQLQGVWIMEIAELTATRKADVEAVKHYISKGVDAFRPAYGRHVETFKRQCVFFGSTNDYDFLNDPTGNRRFLPVVVEGGGSKNMWVDLTSDEVDQVWAEAVQSYRSGMSLALSKEMDEKASELQMAHTQESPIAEAVRVYLDMEVPNDWHELDLNERRSYLHAGNASTPSKPMMKLDKVCAQMVWEEWFQRDVSSMTKYNAKEINGVITNTHGWERVSLLRFGNRYGRQRGFRRQQSATS